MLVNFTGNTKVNLKSRYDFDVKYIDNNSECIARLKYALEYNDPEQFELYVECYGRFQCEGIVDDQSKKEAHVTAYKLLFPYVQNKVSQLTVDAGMSPIMLRMEKMDIEQVHIAGEKE